MRYDRRYRVMVERAIAMGGLNVRSFIDMARDSGMTQEAIEAHLLNDLETGGPIFGKFFRDLNTAAEQAVSVAKRQGEAAARALNANQINRGAFNDLMQTADPEVLEQVEDETAGLIVVTWVAALKNTCSVCLPQHGVSRTVQEWREIGLVPGDVHNQLGWDSKCKCKWREPHRVEEVESLAPLRRVKAETVTGLKGSKRTVRGLSSKDIDLAWRAREKAMTTIEGRRQLRLLGQANKNVPE